MNKTIKILSFVTIIFFTLSLNCLGGVSQLFEQYKNKELAINRYLYEEKIQRHIREDYGPPQFCFDYYWHNILEIELKGHKDKYYVYVYIIWTMNGHVFCAQCPNKFGVNYPICLANDKKDNPLEAAKRIADHFEPNDKPQLDDEVISAKYLYDK